MTGIVVVAGGRFRVSLACPDSEWLDPRRNVFELGGRLPGPPGLTVFLAGLTVGPGSVRPPSWREADCWRPAPVLA